MALVHVPGLRANLKMISVLYRSTGQFPFLSRSPMLSSQAPQAFQRKTLPLSMHSEKPFSTIAIQNGVTSSTEDKCSYQGSDSMASTTANGRRIFVSNIPVQRNNYATRKTILEYFSQFGKIETLTYLRSRTYENFKNAQRGTAYVTFRTDKGFERALAGSHVIDGRNVMVRVARDADASKDMTTALERRSRTVLVSNVLKNTSEAIIAEHFAQFGEIERIVVAQSNNYTDFSSFYVLFSSPFGAKKALEDVSQRIPRQNIDCKVTPMPEQVPVVETQRGCCVKIIMVLGLSAEDLRDYFLQFGDVQSVDIIIDYGSKKSGDIAYASFSDYTVVDAILKTKNHFIKGYEVEVSKGPHKFVPEDGIQELKVSVEGLPYSTHWHEVKDFFEQTYGVILNGLFIKRLNLFDKDKAKCVCIATFSYHAELQRVLKEPKPSFFGYPLKFRQLYWRKLDDISKSV